MEQVALGPPPLPPKTRRSPPDSATVLSGSADDVFAYAVPEVRTGHSQISTPRSGSHVVKIRINPDNGVSSCDSGVVCDIAPCIRISVNSDSDMIQSAMPEPAGDRSGTYYFYAPFNCGSVMSSGQISPSDTLDSGTCSDLDSTPPPLPKKKSSGVSVTVIGAQHKRASSLTSSGADADSDDDESSISCDSLNSDNLPEVPMPPVIHPFKECKASAFLPQGLLQDIRDRSAKLTQPEAEEQKSPEPVRNKATTAVVKECTYEERNRKEPVNLTYDTDKFYKFHLNEHAEAAEDCNSVSKSKGDEDETFAGYKDLLLIGEDGTSATIRSAKGTVRGVKNRVRAGIATFLQYNDHTKYCQALFSAPVMEGYLKKETALDIVIAESKMAACAAALAKHIEVPFVLLNTDLHISTGFPKPYYLNNVYSPLQPNDATFTSRLNSFQHDKREISNKDLKEISSTLQLNVKDAIANVSFVLQNNNLAIARRGTYFPNIANIGGIHCRPGKPLPETYKEKDAGKVVVYATTMGIVRDTYQSCMKVKQILRTLLVKFEERDVFMSTEYQAEIRDRMRCEHILVPQVFVDGQHIGDAETIERLNESGELRRILKPYKSMDACTTCQTCGGYRLLPCPVCNGSKKSVHRNHFTTEFVALKCMNCDEVGLVKCSSCSA